MRQAGIIATAGEPGSPGLDRFFDTHRYPVRVRVEFDRFVFQSQGTLEIDTQSPDENKAWVKS